MAKFSLSTYTIRVLEKSSNSYVKIDKFGKKDKTDTGSDIFKILNEYLSQLVITSSLNRSEKKILHVHKINSDARTLNGIIETGEFGYESNLYNVNNETISHKRQTNEAELLPFYFLIEIPNNVDEGIVILQRFKQFGIRTTILKDFTDFFNNIYPDFRIELNPLVPEKLIDQLLNKGRITKIRFIRFGLHADITDVYDTQDHKEDIGYTELVVSAKRNKNISISGRIQEFLKGEKELNSLIELRNFEYDNIKLGIDFKKNHRTIDLSNLHKLRAYYDITDDVTVGDNGHPSFDSIDYLAKHLIEDLFEAIGIEGSYD